MLIKRTVGDAPLSVHSLAAGNRHSVCRTSSGQIFIWGEVECSGAGSGDLKKIYTPTLLGDVIPSLADKTIHDINIVSSFSLSLTLIDVVRVSGLENIYVRHPTNRVALEPDTARVEPLPDSKSSDKNLEEQLPILTVDIPKDLTPEVVESLATPRSSSRLPSPKSSSLTANWAPLVSREDLTKTDKVFLKIDGVSIPFVFSTPTGLTKTSSIDNISSTANIETVDNTPGSIIPADETNNSSDYQEDSLGLCPISSSSIPISSNLSHRPSKLTSSLVGSSDPLFTSSSIRDVSALIKSLRKDAISYRSLR